VLKDTHTIEELEQASVEKETNTEEVIDLEWRDYDLLPSFTLEGDSLEDEKQSTAVADTSELHPAVEPVEGKLNDLIGYRYQVHGGKIINSRQSYHRPKMERELRRTKRYGLYPDDKEVSTEDFRGGMEDQEMEKVMMDIIASPGLLSNRERKVLSLLYLNNDDEENTYASVAEKFGLKHGMSISFIRNEAVKKIRRAVEMYERTGKISLKESRPFQSF
jgi:hypothetical protein